MKRTLKRELKVLEIAKREVMETSLFVCALMSYNYFRCLRGMLRQRFNRPVLNCLTKVTGRLGHQACQNQFDGAVDGLVEANLSEML